MEGERPESQSKLRRESSSHQMQVYDPLLCALESGQTETVQNAFTEGYSLKTMKGGAKAIHVAYDRGHWDILRYMLVQQNANIDVVDERGQTLLHKSVECGNLYVTEELLDLGANIHCTRESDGFAAVHLCAKSGSLDLMQLLLTRRADPKMEAQNEHNETVRPLELALKNGNTLVAQCLQNELDPEILKLKEIQNDYLSRLSPNAKRGAVAKFKVTRTGTSIPLADSVKHNLQNIPLTDEHLRMEFDCLDTNSCGTISKEQFVKLYQSCNDYGAPPKDVNVLLSNYNVMGEDVLSFDEFCVLRLKIAQW